MCQEVANLTQLTNGYKEMQRQYNKIKLKHK